MQRMTKKDYYEMGQRAAQGNPPETVPTSGWQRRAYDEGYASVSTTTPLVVRATTFAKINVEALVGDFTPGWNPGQREHLKRLATDYNAENRRDRRLRLYRAVGRQLDKHGVREAIPLIPTT